MRAFVFFACVLIAILSGCQNSHQLYEAQNIPSMEAKGNQKKNVPVYFFGERELKTLDLNDEAFNTVGEWLDNEHILYVIDTNAGSNIFSFNLFTGEKKLFYTTNAPVVSMRANSDHSKFLIQTAPSSYEAELLVLNKKGKVLYSQRMKAFELYYVWNPFRNDQLLITSFLSDWSYQTYIMDVTKKQFLSRKFPQPFMQWMMDDVLAYIQWNENEPSLTGPLYQLHLKTNEKMLLKPNTISFTAFPNYLLTVENDSKNPELGQLTFYNTSSMKVVQKISMPLLSAYSEWLIPFHDFFSEEMEFYIFMPYSSGEFDTYTEKFALYRLSLKNGNGDTILDKVENMPLNISPDGSLCLYGYQYENIIDLKKKKIYHFVQS
jgi:hypothetical protein